MSRIGKQPIEIPSGVAVEVKDLAVTVKGPKGELSMTLDPRVSAEQVETDGKQVLNLIPKDAKEDSAIWGTMRALLNNIVTGVTEGWSKQLELNGVGFRMQVQGSTLKMNLGFSHEIAYEIPKGIDATIDGNILTIAGADRQLVGEVAAEIRAFKKPEPYKGKGFRYTDEIVRRKVGKAAKAE